MTWFDYFIIGIIVLSALISLLRGFIREAFSLAIWILAFWISWSFFRDLSFRFEGLIETPTVRLGVAFAILMIASLMLGGLVNYLLIQLVEKTGLTGTDRLIGMIFGVARGAMLVAVLVIVAGLTPIPQDRWWKQSVLVPYFEELALWMLDQLPEDVASRFRYATARDGRSVDVVGNTHRPTATDNTESVDVVGNTHRPTATGNTESFDVVGNTHRPTATGNTESFDVVGNTHRPTARDGRSEENAGAIFFRPPYRNVGRSWASVSSRHSDVLSIRSVDVVWNIHRPTTPTIPDPIWRLS